MSNFATAVSTTFVGQKRADGLSGFPEMKFGIFYAHELGTQELSTKMPEIKETYEKRERISL